MGTSIDAIVIPTGGNSEEDLQRAKKAIFYQEENNLSVPYIISGVSADHDKLHNYLLENTSQFIGVENTSKNTLENIQNTFPLEQKGNYLWVSYNLHNKKTEKLRKNLQSSGKISKEISIDYINTKTSLYQFIYGLAALLEVHGVKIPFKNILKNN